MATMRQRGDFSDYSLGYGHAIEHCREMRRQGRLSEALRGSPHCAPRSVEDVDEWREGWRDALNCVAEQEAEHRHARNLGREG